MHKLRFLSKTISHVASPRATALESLAGPGPDPAASSLGQMGGQGRHKAADSHGRLGGVRRCALGARPASPASVQADSAGPSTQSNARGTPSGRLPTGHARRALLLVYRAKAAYVRQLHSPATRAMGRVLVDKCRLERPLSPCERIVTNDTQLPMLDQLIGALQRSEHKAPPPVSSPQG